MDDLDPWLCAFTEVWPARARTVALEVDRAVRRGEALPLAGVPLGLKASEGAGSLQAQRLIAAGCVPVGTTSVAGKGTDWQTWGWTDRGPTVNPWRPDLSPGGSSAGSAAAVGAGCVPLATGSDGAGSVRIPAAWCGIVGAKPTNGALPARDRAGLNVGGPLARTVEDAAAYWQVVIGEDPLRVRPAEPPRAAWSATLGYAATQDEVRGTAWRAARALFASGCVEERETEVALLDPEPAWRGLRSGHPDAEAVRVREENERRLERLFGDVDVLLTPTTPNRPHGHRGPGGAMSVAMAWVFNVSGHPAVTVPAGRTEDGCPVGLQLVGRRGEEATVFSAALAVERSGRGTT
ncbi:amidase family protein [Wenjunlia tyrosinilytica]|nr:amidase [Wenjunlia tyrosinilytica]